MNSYVRISRLADAIMLKPTFNLIHDVVIVAIYGLTRKRIIASELRDTPL